MMVQIGGNTVSVQVQSSGIGAALTINQSAASDAASAAASAATATAAQAAASASAAAAAATLANAALKSANLSDLANAATAKTNLGIVSYWHALLATASQSAFLTALGQIASTFINFTQAGTGAIARALNLKLGEIVSPEDFGAVGDGATNDTAALQAALNTLKTVVGKPGATYLLSKAAGTTRCILWKSGMRWDGNGSTPKLANNQQPCSLIQAEYATAGGATVSNTMLKGRFDGNTANQGTITPGGSWFTPTIDMRNVSASEFDVEVLNGHLAGFYAQGTTYAFDNRANQIRVKTARGYGVSLGGTGWQIDRIVVEATEHDDALVADLQGNGFIINGSDHQVGEVALKNCGWGVKVQDGATRVDIASIRNVSGANTKDNPAVKIEGQVGLRNSGITLGRVYTNGFNSNGLYIVYSDGVSVGSYRGKGNGLTAGSLAPVERSEIRIIETTDLQIAAVSATPGLIGVTIEGAATQDIQIGPMNLSGVAAGFFWPYYLLPTTTDGCNIQLGDINVASTSSTWNRLLIQADETTTKVNCTAGKITVNTALSNWVSSTTPLLNPPLAGQIRTGPIIFKGSAISGSLAMTASSATTDLSASMARHGTKHGPIINVSASNSAGITLGGTKDYGAFDLSASASGVRFYHTNSASTGAAIQWHLMGYVAPYYGVAS